MRKTPPPVRTTTNTVVATADLSRIRNLIRSVPDFPRPGILFRDISPVLQDARAFSETLDLLAELASREEIQFIAAPEARGFIFGAPLAVKLGCGFIPLRKSGKLPYETTSVTYALEYGEDTVAMHVDAVNPGDRVLLVDDVLATGGTMRACAQLIESQGARVAACLFFLELSFLSGRRALKDYDVRSLIQE